MIKTLEKKQKDEVKGKIIEVTCPKCKKTNKFVDNNKLVLVCKVCGQALGLSIFY